MGSRLRHWRVTHKGSALADEPINLGDLRGAIAPFVPPVPPELPEKSGRGEYFGVGFSHKNVDELLASDGTQARTPSRRLGLSADESVEYELSATGQDTSAPTFCKLT